MCTLSFLPEAQGFHLLMNRDEQRSRPMGLSPNFHPCGVGEALYPSESGGGTWIGVNQSGMTLALINWYSRSQLRTRPAFSRGQIIPWLLAQRTLHEVHSILSELPLCRLNPFRLIGISPAAQEVTEWRSDHVTLESFSTSWRRTHWFSSGFEEAEVSLVRGETAERHFARLKTETYNHLQELHGAHEPEKGAYSICMHREDACTVSCTGLSVSAKSATMTYQAGSPCEAPMTQEKVLFFDSVE